MVFISMKLLQLILVHNIDPASIALRVITATVTSSTGLGGEERNRGHRFQEDKNRLPFTTAPIVINPGAVFPLTVMSLFGGTVLLGEP